MSESEFVYFIGPRLGPIKIGKAADVKKRLSGLQTSCHEALIVFGVVKGDYNLEKSLHQKFAKLRIRGEWFRRCQPLLSFISEHRDISLWPHTAGLSLPKVIDPNKTIYGLVQVIDEDDERFGKFGYWDDDECEITDRCEKCQKTDDDECSECTQEQFAVVYFGEFSEGAELCSYDVLGKIDESIEVKAGRETLDRLLPDFARVSSEETA